MNAFDLIRRTARSVKVSQPQAKKVVDQLFKEIVIAIQEGESIKIRRFGSFNPTHKKATRCKSIKTGKFVDVPPKNSMGFKMSKILKEELNG